MKEVKFSWYDRDLVNLTVREKFHVLFWFPLLMILGSAHETEKIVR